jgi:hypothetical protein
MPIMTRDDWNKVTELLAKLDKLNEEITYSDGTKSQYGTPQEIEGVWQELSAFVRPMFEQSMEYRNLFKRIITIAFDGDRGYSPQQACTTILHIIHKAGI